MKNCILQTLLLLLGCWCLQSCDDAADLTDLSKANAAAAVMPSKVSFKQGDTQPATFNMSVAVSTKASETVRFEIKVSDKSEVSAEKVNVTSEQLVIQKGKRSAETVFTIEADAVDKGTKNLILDLISSNAKVKNQQITIPVTMKLNTIKHFAGESLKVNLTGDNWAEIYVGDVRIAGLWQSEMEIGAAPSIPRIHLETYGGDVIATADGDVLNLTPLEEGTVIGTSSKWLENPKWSQSNYMYVPVLYSAGYKDWLGKTAYAGVKISGLNAWFKFTVTEDAEFVLTEFAYDEDGNDIKAGQTDSTK